MKTVILILIIVQILTGSVMFMILAGSESTSQPVLAAATVAHVIDGDTIVLTTGERVRLIGVDAPEIGTCGADEAAAFVRDRVLNRTVWLSSSGADLDRFGRLRRYVWIQYPTDAQDEAQIQAKQLNALLLSHGYAQLMVVRHD